MTTKFGNEMEDDSFITTFFEEANEKKLIKKCRYITAMNTFSGITYRFTSAANPLRGVICEDIEELWA